MVPTLEGHNCHHPEAGHTAHITNTKSAGLGSRLQELWLLSDVSGKWAQITLLFLLLPPSLLPEQILHYPNLFISPIFCLMSYVVGSDWWSSDPLSEP